MHATGKRCTVALFLSGCLCLLFLCRLPAQTSRGSDLAIVVHPDIPYNNLNLAELRKVFLRERQFWNAKIPVVLYMRPPSSHEGGVILRVIYEMTEVQYRRYWMYKIYRAEVTSDPAVVYSSADANSLVAATPGAITFIAGGEVGPGLKVLRVDGHSPGEPGYPLH